MKTIGSGLLYKSQASRPHIVQGHGVSKEVEDLRDDIQRGLLPMAALAVERLIPEAASTTDLLAATATVTTAVTVTTFLAGGIAKLKNCPRNLIFTVAGGTPAHAPATAVVKGKDAQGRIISETVTLPQTATFVSTVNCYADLISVTYPAGDGTSATVALGTGSYIGLSRKARPFVSAPALVAEILGDTLVGPNATWLDNIIDAPAADDDAFFTATVGVLGTAALVVNATSFDGVVGKAALTWPRPVTLTSASSAGVAAGNAVVEGYDVYGNYMKVTIALVDDGVATTTSFFMQLVKVTLPAQAGGVTATVKVGFGAALGLSRKAIAHGGFSSITPIQEVAVGAVVTTGTFADATAAPPNGSYTPAAAANGARDYAVLYPHKTAGQLVAPATMGPYGAYLPAHAPDGVKQYTIFYEYDASLDV